MLDYKEIKFHHDNTVTNCINTIRGLTSVMPADVEAKFIEALGIWDKYNCSDPNTAREDIALGLAALTMACGTLQNLGTDAMDYVLNAIETLRHKLLPHTVDEASMKGANLSTRAGLCPVCGQPVSTIMSQDRCYYCDSKLVWK